MLYQLMLSLNEKYLPVWTYVSETMKTSLSNEVMPLMLIFSTTTSISFKTSSYIFICFSSRLKNRLVRGMKLFQQSLTETELGVKSFSNN